MYCSKTQRSDVGEDRTRGPESSPLPLSHCAPSLFLCKLTSLARKLTSLAHNMDDFTILASLCCFTDMPQNTRIFFSVWLNCRNVRLTIPLIYDTILFYIIQIVSYFERTNDTRSEFETNLRQFIPVQNVYLIWIGSLKKFPI